MNLKYFPFVLMGSVVCAQPDLGNLRSNLTELSSRLANPSNSNTNLQEEITNISKIINDLRNTEFSFLSDAWDEFAAVIQGDDKTFAMTTIKGLLDLLPKDNKQNKTSPNIGSKENPLLIDEQQPDRPQHESDIAELIDQIREEKDKLKKDKLVAETQKKYPEEERKRIEAAKRARTLPHQESAMNIQQNTLEGLDIVSFPNAQLKDPELPENYKRFYSNVVRTLFHIRDQTERLEQEKKKFKANKNWKDPSKHIIARYDNGNLLDIGPIPGPSSTDPLYTGYRDAIETLKKEKAKLEEKWNEFEKKQEDFKKKPIKYSEYFIVSDDEKEQHLKDEPSNKRRRGATARQEVAKSTAEEISNQGKNPQQKNTAPKEQNKSAVIEPTQPNSLSKKEKQDGEPLDEQLVLSLKEILQEVCIQKPEYKPLAEKIQSEIDNGKILTATQVENAINTLLHLMDSDQRKHNQLSGEQVPE